MSAVALVALSCSRKRRCWELGALGHLQGSILMPLSSFDPLGYVQESKSSALRWTLWAGHPVLIWEVCSVLSCTADHMPRAQGRRPEKDAPMLSEVITLSSWALLSRGGSPAVLSSRTETGFVHTKRKAKRLGREQRHQ